MNKQKAPGGIEWTRIKRSIDGNAVELPGYTWNPTAGCFHGCTWKMPDGSIAECYAKTVAERLATRTYDKGFENHYILKVHDLWFVSKRINSGQVKNLTLKRTHIVFILVMVALISDCSLCS